MLKKKSLIALILAIVMICSMLVACGGDTGAAPGGDTPGTSAAPGGDKKETYTIKIGTTYSKGHYLMNGYEAFEQYVEEKSGGQIQVEIFPDSTIVTGDRDCCEYVSTGALQMANSDYTMIGTFANDSRWESTSIPFYYGTEPENVYKILDNSKIWAQMYDELAESSNLRILGAVNSGAATIIQDEHPITSMGDFKGLRIRTPESDPYVKPIELFGGSPIPMSFSEIYTSVQNGVIDGVFTSKSAIVQYQFTDVCKYQLDANVFLLLFGIMINADFYESLPADLKTIVDDGAKVLVDVARKDEVAFRDSLDTAMAEAGVTVIKPDAAFVAEMTAALEPYIQVRREALGDFVTQLDKEMEEILK